MGTRSRLAGKGLGLAHVALLAGLGLVSCWIVGDMVGAMSTQAGDPDGGFIATLDIMLVVFPIQVLAYAVGVLTSRLRGVVWQVTLALVGLAALAALAVERSHHLVEVVSNMTPLWPWEHTISYDYYLSPQETFGIVATVVLLALVVGLLAGGWDRFRTREATLRSDADGSGVGSGTSQHAP